MLSNGVSVNLQAALLFEDEITAAEVLNAFSADDDILQALLLKTDGSLFAEYRKDGLVALAPNQKLQAEIVDKGYALGNHAIYVLIPITLGSEEIAKIRLIVSKQGLDNTRISAIQVAFTLFGLIIIFSYLFISKIQQWVITPVVSLNEAMQGIILHAEFGQWHGEVLEHDNEGNELPLYIKASKIKDEEQNNQSSYIFIFSNLSDAKERDRLYYLAHHDTLTGLPNRSKFYKSVNKTLKQHQDSIGQFGLCYLDLDGFKSVNDTYGHDAGDEVLRVFEKRLENSVRKGDFACRLAGDEFVLFIDPVYKKNQLAELSHRVIESIQQPISYQGNILCVGVSIGITISRYSDGKEVDYLLKESDKAMYEAKLSGKGQYVFYKQ